jgi:hypothetical protein
MQADALEGVRATAVTADNTLVVVADGHVDLYDELVAAVVRSGQDPPEVRVAALERLIDPTGLAFDTAVPPG